MKEFDSSGETIAVLAESVCASICSENGKEGPESFRGTRQEGPVRVVEELDLASERQIHKLPDTRQVVLDKLLYLTDSHMLELAAVQSFDQLVDSAADMQEVCVLGNHHSGVSEMSEQSLEWLEEAECVQGEDLA